jgi:hypothetical protein
MGGQSRLGQDHSIDRKAHDALVIRSPGDGQAMNGRSLPYNTSKVNIPALFVTVPRAFS